MKVKIKGVSLFDDLGNTRIGTDKRIKPRLLYRSSHLAKIEKDQEEKLINKYNVRYVVDFRTDDEIASFPELEDSEIKHYHFPALTNEQNTVITKKNRLRILKKITASKGGAIAHMHTLYHNILTSAKAIEAFRNFFTVLLEAKENEAVVFHCTQGKDRTGMAMTLLLAALGADNDLIIKKYMSYNALTRNFRFWVSVGMSLFKSPRLALSLDRMIGARKVYIRKVLETVENVYGGFKNYLNNTIGLSDDEINQLRLKYLY